LYLFPKFSTFALQLGCLLFLPENETYTETEAAYERVVNGYGPDDFNNYKKFVYNHINTMAIPDLVGVLRLSAYDSTMFQHVLPRIKQLASTVTFNERKRLGQTMHQTWDMYFTLNESTDIAFEIGGIFYQLGFYEDALTYFEHSKNLFGDTADVFYNKALCYYQLRKDDLFVKTLKEAKFHFPSVNFGQLDKLNLGAV
ncbi:MAG: tetratricopeptide repeat protein, partial [Chitinophagales bacterium]